MPISFPRAAMLAAALLPMLVAAAPSSPASPLSLDAALALAAARSESTRAARAGVASAEQAAHAAAQLPDPTLRAGIDNLPATGADRFRTHRDTMTMARVGISQEWLSADKRAARQGAADAALAREAVLAQAAAADTRRQTALAYVDAFYAGESLQLALRLQAHAHEELEVARARLSSAAGSSQELLALAGASGLAQDETAEVRQQQGAASVALQRWTGVLSDALQPPGAIVLPSEEAYVAGHPTVAALQRGAELARQTAAVTATQRRPNWTWELAYGQRSGHADMVSVGVSIPLPVAPRERQDRETAAQLALADKAEAELAEARRAAAADYRQLHGDAQRLAQRIARYGEAVLAPARQRRAVATAGYEANQGSLAAVFEARQAEVQAQRRLLALQRELAVAQVQLAYRPLSAEVAP
ncbi:MAG TPA: TolC family protein [Pseudorhodoferax sp.]|nr:TolC family protein [Pseudorhodoferax sp.]